MEREGKLSREKFGYSMPVDAPLYAKPPIYYRDAEAISVAFESDEEAVAAMTPAGLAVPSPVVVTVRVLTYHFSTLGMYNEAYLGFTVLRSGEPAFYIPHILVDNDQAMTAGREIWGYPKKLAQISLQNRGDGVVGIVERPAGNRICTAVVQPEQPLENQAAGIPGLSLRVIPGLGENDGPALAQLIETRTTVTSHGSWGGRASLSFGAASGIDPWSGLPVKKVLGGSYQRFDMILPLGRVVLEY